MSSDMATQERCESAISGMPASPHGKPEEGLVCTLFEGDYHFGLAALVNSLARHGYRGCIAAGYRGALPPWVEQLRPLDGQLPHASERSLSGAERSYEVCPGVRIDFIRLDTPVHFVYFKPQFMLQLLGERRGCKSIYYFDPDIVIVCAWSFYAQWIRYGVALCEDVNAAMPENHPLRCEWRDMFAPLGPENPRPLQSYYNSGFVGLPENCKSFLHRWVDALRIAESRGLDLRGFAGGDQTDPTEGKTPVKALRADRAGIRMPHLPFPPSGPFTKGDQDLLNIAAMYSEHPLTTLGPEGMGFIHGCAAMYHAIGATKPWRKKMVREALRGFPPSAADKAYLAYMAHPIHPYSPLGLARRRTECALGAALGRFYGRR